MCQSSAISPSSQDYRSALTSYSGNTMPYQMADLALLGADKKRLSHRWASSLAVSLALSIVFFLQMGGSYCTLMLAVKALTHTLMLSEREASALQEEFVPWHKERCDFQSAHIHLTHPDSRPWSRVMSSPAPLLPPSPRAGLCTYLIRMSAVQTARHSSKVLPRDWGRVESRHTRKNKQWSSRAFPFLAKQRGIVRYFNKNKKSLGRTHPTCSQLNVGQVMSWLYTQPCHMTGPHREGHSTHDSSAVKCAVGLRSSTCWSRQWCQTGAVCGCVLLSQEMSSFPLVAEQTGSFPLDGLLVSAGLRRALQICLWIKVILLYYPERQWRQRSRENCAIV